MQETNSIVEVEKVETKESLTMSIIAEKEYLEKLTIVTAISVGKKLKSLKDLVDHGEWYEYIEKNIGFSKRKVQNLMLFSEKYGEEGSAYFDIFSNASTPSDLSYSKALELLSIDENEVETFVENTEIENITVKELRKEIKEFKQGKEEALRELTSKEEELETLKGEVEELEQTCQNMMNGKDDYAKQIRNLNEEIERLEGQLNETSTSTSEPSQEKIEELERQLQEAKDKINETEIKAVEEKEKTEALIESEKAKLEDLLKEEREKAKGETSEEIERLQLEVKKLNASSDEKMIKFKLLADEVQKNLNDINGVIEEVSLEDEEKAEKMKGAIKQVIERLVE